MVLAVLRGYKIFISPLFAGSCRFTPSCADYTAEAVRLHGARAGLLLGLTRLGRCRPLGAWGFDPVPHVRRRTSHSGHRTSDHERSLPHAGERFRAKVQ
jgi:putative membrane protein insertion efficiency factor